MNATKITTVSTDFYRAGGANRSLFAVQGGLPAEEAVNTACCILESLGRMAAEGTQGGIGESQSYGMKMLLDMAQALVGSLDGQV